MSPLTRFTFRGRPDTYASRVAAAVLAPAFGGPLRRHHTRSGAVLAEFETHWRRRVSVLDDARDELLGAGLASAAELGPWRPRRMLDCYPAVGLHDPVTPFCRGAAFDLCPHCWARKAVALWQAVDRRLFPPPPPPAPQGHPIRPLIPVGRPTPIPRRLEGRALVIRTLRTGVVPRGDSELVPGKTVLATLLQSRATGRRVPRDPASAWVPRAVDFRRLAAAGALGGIEVLTVAVVRDVGFRIRVRQLLVVPADRVTAFLADPRVRAHEDLTPRLRTFREPRRFQLVRLVAGLCLYPPSLLRGDRTTTIEYLAARPRLRLTATFGCLHGDDPNMGAETGS
jgi:hypothetical protein